VQNLLNIEKHLLLHKNAVILLLLNHNNNMSNSSDSNSSDGSSSSEENDFEFEVFQNDYLVLYKLGSGAFSTVWLVYQISKNDFFALKIQNDDCYDEGLLEKSCLEVVSKFPTNCLIKLVDSFVHKEDGKEYLCMVLELAIDSAYYFLKCFREDNKGYPPAVMKKLHDDVNEGLSYLHGNNLLHTDIKPENILVCGKDKRLEILKKKLDKIKFKQMYESQIELYRQKFDMSKKTDKDKFRKGKKNILLKIVNELAKVLNVEEIYSDLNYLNYTEEELLQCTFKLADLGTVHSYDQMIAERRFPCIQTRYYRAPEVILKLPYNHKVDFWSMAAMYYELVEGKTMFDPHHEGSISTDQVHLYQMIDWIGNPSKEKINISPLKKFFDKEGKLKYAVEYLKENINPEKWHPEVLAFFTANLSWRS